MSMPSAAFRLAQEVKPVSYDLYLHPDLVKGTFEGRVSILVDVADKRKSITLHQKDLSISSVKLQAQLSDSNNNVEIEESHPHNDNETFTIIPKKALDIGLYKLNLSFTGSLQNKIVGFYSSKYKDEQNKTR